MLRSFLASVLALAAAAAAGAEERIALVIGNGAYPETVGPLVNPPRDARLIASTLEEVGFEVALTIDADQETMIDAIAVFEDRLARAGEDAVALLYYAGHGVQDEGRNYMIPVGAAIDRARYYRTRAVSVDEAQEAMRASGARLSFIILDACRNNPLPRSVRDASGGLATMNPAAGFVIAFATAPGDVASDGEGDNSPYALALADALTRQGLEADAAFRRVTERVQSATRGAQLPWVNSTRTGGDFCFAGCSPSPSASPGTPDPGDEAAWAAVAGDCDAAAYLAAYPNGAYAAAARLRAARCGAGEPADPLARALGGIDGDAPGFSSQASANALAARFGVEAVLARADAGDPMAALIAGRLLMDGSRLAGDKAAAARRYREGCEGGVMAACNNLGVAYAIGAGVESDEAEAARLYRRACDGGNAVGCTSLGNAYRDGVGVAESGADAVRLYLQACEGGHATGCAYLGWAYKEGQGVAQDHGAAARRYRQGCDLGSAFGCNDLGMAFQKGRGVEQDDGAAVRLYRQSCDGGSSSGCYNAGWMIDQGRGGGESAAQAAEFFRRAVAIDGHEDAAYLLERIEEERRDTP
ncbi:MAG: caspase family protein [Caulobacterales bacterium]|nr:caspase family protein [Caulobacterales bacterium]